MFDQTITVYHLKADTTYSKHFINNVFFEHHEGVKVNKGVENASSGTIIIPSKSPINIAKNDVIIEGKTSDILDTNNRIASLQSKYKIYTVISIDDNRFGDEIPHWEIGVA